MLIRVFADTMSREELRRKKLNRSISLKKQ
jgi:hypothetical protein